MGRVVERSKRSTLLNGLHNGVIDQDRGSKLFSAVNNTVADSIDFLHGGNNAVYGARQLINNSCNGLSMGREVDVFIEDFFAFHQRGVLQMPADTDSFTETFCQNGLRLHVDQLIF